MREVITLQFGRAANFTGTHLWNSLDDSRVLDQSTEADSELRHEQLFRTSHRTTTPRLLIFDLQSSLASLHPSGPLYTELEDETAAVPEAARCGAGEFWSGAVEAHVEDVVPKNDFLRWLEGEEVVKGVTPASSEVGVSTGWGVLAPNTPNAETDEQLHKAEDAQEVLEATPSFEMDSVVQTWTDYSKTFLHPRSMNMLHNFGTNELDVYTYGMELMSHSKIRERIEDNVRFFLEECDRLEGIHVIVDVDSGFGSVAERVLTDLVDECPSVARIVFGVKAPLNTAATEATTAASNRDSIKSTRCIKRNLNVGLSLAAFADLGTVYVPEAPGNALQRNRPLLDGLRDDFIFHTSALSSAAIDGATLPYRVRRADVGSAASLGDLARGIVLRPSMNVASLRTAFPFPHPSPDKAEISRWWTEDAANGAESPQTLRPEALIDSIPRVYGDSIVLRGVEGDIAGLRFALGRLSDDKNVQRVGNAYLTNVTLPWPITIPFPNIFSSTVGPRGGIQGGISTADGSADKRPMSARDTEDIQTKPFSVPTMTRMSICSSQQTDLRAIADAFKFRPLSALFAYEKGRGGIGNDEFSDLQERLLTIAENYE